MTDVSVQERYAPRSICFGCGPANKDGLHIRSFVDGESLVATFTPSPTHEAFPGMLNGGIIGTLLDCHCNWAGSLGLMRRDGLSHPPCTVTAEYTIRMRKPTPSDQPVTLRARIVQMDENRVTVDGELEAQGRVTATCRGLFVAVEPGHPAYRRW